MATTNKELQHFNSFAEFYPFYLAEHANQTCRRLHFIGSTLVLTLLVSTIFSQNWVLLWLLPVIGYGFAWVGHFFFEHNRPATFKHPLYSFIGDWVMAKDMLTGKISF
ncbi:Mpo1-like protein [Zhongshania arctica]|uniref:Mpo1-like protein n=1 Tax=Zhongshania arctica TaxID=3238302 RepID=A0ABV3TV82_9GAMM|tara:strand:+ start:10748 stop:11071 length:324 start_codon:yes stop_codon:yes gene_type:complete